MDTALEALTHCKAVALTLQHSAHIIADPTTHKLLLYMLYVQYEFWEPAVKQHYKNPLEPSSLNIYG